VLEQEKAIWLPLIQGTAGGETVTTHDRQRFRFETVRLESRMGEVVPDVVLSKGNRELIVEVQVTHACDAVKIAKLQAAGISTLEVDLSAYRMCTDEAEVRRAILSDAPRHWLVNSKLVEATAVARARATEIGTERRRAAEAMAGELRRQLVEAPKIAEAPYKSTCDRVEALGLGHLLDGPEPAISGFALATRVWRAVMIERVIYPAAAPGDQCWQPTVDPDKAAETLRDLWAPPLRRATPPEVLRVLSRQPSPVIHPIDAVRVFIEEIVQDGLLAYAKGNYSLPSHHRQTLRDRARALAGKMTRTREMAEKIESILKLSDEDEIAGFSLKDWMQTPPTGFINSPGTLVDEGGDEYDRLATGLDRLTPMPWRRSVPTDALGLPIKRYIDRQAEMARAAAEAAEAAEQVEAERERLGRTERIKTYAAAVLGWSGHDWLDVCPPNSAATRLAIAADSDEGYERVRRQIDRVGDERRIAQETAEAMTRRQAALRREASAVFNDAHAAFFLENPRNELGRRTPLQACDSDRGFDAAVRLLPLKRSR
jgi:hypothetical protein